LKFILVSEEIIVTVDQKLNLLSMVAATILEDREFIKDMLGVLFIEVYFEIHLNRG
jgi:hypothetical protein